MIDIELSIPAVGQGALGIEIRSDRPDVHALLQPLNHPETAACVEAERAMSRALAGSCTVPLGAFGQMRGNQLHVIGFVASIDGGEMVRANVSGAPQHADALGRDLAEKLVALGADRILAALDNHA